MASAALPSCPHCGADHPADRLRCPETDIILPLAGRLLDGRFAMLELLGRGGMASVWLAQNTRVDRLVAIKLIRPEVARDADMVMRFRSEARAAGRSGHPNICDVLDSGISPIGPYIVMEYLRGRSLGELLAERGRLPYATAVMLIREALDGLDAAHHSGIVHRDLKPENLFLHRPDAGSPTVKLMDFGVAKFIDGTGETRTEHGALLGTPEYMAPEQFRGAAFAEVRTDIWAMGAILYRAIAGQNAFGGPTVAATLLMVSSENPWPIERLVADVPAGLVAVIDRCLKKNPRDRWPDAATMSSALAPFTVDTRDLSPWDVVTTSAQPPTHGTPARTPALRSADEADAADGAAKVAAPSRADGASGARSSEATRTSEPPDGATSDATAAVRQGSRRRWIAIAAVVLAGAALAAALLSRAQGPHDRVQAEAPPAAAPQPLASPRLPAVTAAPDAALPPSPDVPRDPGADVDEVVVVIDSESSAAETPFPRVPPAPAPRTSAVTPTTGGIQHSPPIDPPPDPPGVIRAGHYVAIVKAGPAGNHKTGEAHCKSLARERAAGITRWELANPTVASKFVASGRLRRGKYWTSALWRGRALAISVPAGEQVSLPAKDRRPRPLCVARWP